MCSTYLCARHLPMCVQDVDSDENITLDDMLLDDMPLSRRTSSFGARAQRITSSSSDGSDDSENYKNYKVRIIM